MARLSPLFDNRSRVRRFTYTSSWLQRLTTLAALPAPNPRSAARVAFSRFFCVSAVCFNYRGGAGTSQCQQPLVVEVRRSDLPLSYVIQDTNPKNCCNVLHRVLAYSYLQLRRWLRLICRTSVSHINLARNKCMWECACTSEGLLHWQAVFSDLADRHDLLLTRFLFLIHECSTEKDIYLLCSRAN